MRLHLAVRVKRGWKIEVLEDVPYYVVKEWRDKLIEMQIEHPHEILFDLIKIGEKCFSSCSGTLTELHNAGCKI